MVLNKKKKMCVRCSQAFRLLSGRRMCQCIFFFVWAGGSSNCSGFRRERPVRDDDDAGSWFTNRLVGVTFIWWNRVMIYAGHFAQMSRKNVWGDCEKLMGCYMKLDQHVLTRSIAIGILCWEFAELLWKINSNLSPNGVRSKLCSEHEGVRLGHFVLISKPMFHIARSFLPHMFYIQCIQFFFPKLCLILKNRFLAWLSSNFQKRLLMKYFMPQFVFGVSIFSLRA